MVSSRPAEILLRIDAADGVVVHNASVRFAIKFRPARVRHGSAAFAEKKSAAVKYLAEEDKKEKKKNHLLQLIRTEWPKG